MNIKITRVNTKTIQQSSPIDFKTVYKKDNTLLKSKSNVSQTGVKGEKKITLNVTYENGKEKGKKVVKETLVKKPQDKIIVQGNLPATTYSRGQSSNSAVKVINAKSSIKVINVKASSTVTKKSYSRGSNTSGKTLYVKSTAYSATNGANTASGRKAVRNAGGYSTIAVDPHIIPLGTRLYIEGYGNAIASDTGSAIQGKVIDLFFNTNAEACSWGVRYLKIHILS